MTALDTTRVDDTTRLDRGVLDQYTRSDLSRSLWGLATSVVPFLVFWALMFVAFPVSYWLVLLLAIPATGFLVRTYILFHDCVHGSFLSGRRANAWVGTALALLVLTPFARWRYEHLVHHATASDLDRRGVGDVPVLTLAEYQSKPWWGRLGYRLLRNPVVLFGLGPIYSTLIMQRIPNPLARQRMHRSVWGMNLAVVILIAALCWRSDGRRCSSSSSPWSCSRAASGCGSSTCSTSTRRATGTTPRSGASRTRR